MNSSLNETFQNLEYWFLVVGNSWLFDQLYVYTLLPFYLIALGFALLSYLILAKKEFDNNSFFKYMRAYVLNSIFLFAILATTFIPLTKFVFKFTNSYESIFYGCYFYIPLLSVFYLNSSFIEICIVVERLLYFLPAKYQRIKIIGFNKFSILLFLVCFLISLPNFFLAYPGYMDVKLDKDTTFRIYFWGNTEFSQSFIGFIINGLMYFVRDILTLIVKIILNIKLIIMVRNYLSKIKMEKLAFAEKISSGLVLHNKISNKPAIVNDCEYISKTERNQTYIALSMCIFSLFNHLFYTLTYMLYFANIKQPSSISFYMALITLGLKHVSNFFILYKYKYSFRVVLKNSLKKVFLKRK